jgi:hypothetical protein
MRFVFCALFIGSLCALSACGKQQASASPQPAATAQAQSSTPAPAMQPAGAVASPQPGGTLPPPPTTIAGKPVITPQPGATIIPPPSGKSAAAQPMPPALMEKLTRPLTREEIDKLPPDVRNMILRAQGRLPATPAPKK